MRQKKILTRLRPTRQAPGDGGKQIITSPSRKMVSIYWLRILLLGGLRRFEIGKDVVFYVLLSNGIKIVRVLHQQMIPAKSLLDR